MEVRKNRFFTFLCSLFPGAGEMYMGAFGKGAIIMVAFCFWCCLSYEMNMLFLFASVLWFYSFMDTHHLKYLSNEEVKKSNDDFVKKILDLSSGKNSQSHTYKRLGWFIVFIGVLFFLISFIGHFDYVVSRVLIGLFVTFIIIFIGIRMIRRRAGENMDSVSEAEGFNSEIIDGSDEICDDENCSCESHINELIDEAIAEKHCPHCGAEVFEEDKFCSECGKSLIPKEPEERLCSCGQKLSESAKFCPNCGKSLIPEEPSEKVCSCGQKLSEDTKFCPICGKKYEDENPADGEEKA